MWAWFWLLAGACTEVGWIAGLKMAHTPALWAATACSAVASVLLALGATRSLPATTVYNLFIGLGAIGAVGLEVVVFGATLHPLSYVFLGLLLACVIGLKFSSNRAH